MEKVHIINNKVMVIINPVKRCMNIPVIALAAVICCGVITLSACGVEDRSWKNNEAGGSSVVNGDESSQTQDYGPGPDSGEGQNSQETGEKISFEIPDEWRWTDLRKRDAVRGQPEPADPGMSLVKLELLGVSEGDAASAESSVKKMFETYKTDCLNQGSDCAASPEYLELDAAGVRVYCAMSASRSFSPDKGWSTYLEFAKNGGKAGFMLYDRADRQKDLLEKVTSTITWK